jgi:hypothetical protein
MSQQEAVEETPTPPSLGSGPGQPEAPPADEPFYFAVEDDGGDYQGGERSTGAEAGLVHSDSEVSMDSWPGRDALPTQPVQFSPPSPHGQTSRSLGGSYSQPAWMGDEAAPPDGTEPPSRPAHTTRSSPPSRTPSLSRTRGESGASYSAAMMSRTRGESGASLSAAAPATPRSHASSLHRAASLSRSQRTREPSPPVSPRDLVAAYSPSGSSGASRRRSSGGSNHMSVAVGEEGSRRSRTRSVRSHSGDPMEPPPAQDYIEVPLYLSPEPEEEDDGDSPASAGRSFRGSMGSRRGYDDEGVRGSTLRSHRSASGQSGRGGTWRGDLDVSHGSRSQATSARGPHPSGEEPQFRRSSSGLEGVALCDGPGAAEGSRRGSVASRSHSRRSSGAAGAVDAEVGIQAGVDERHDQETDASSHYSRRSSVGPPQGGTVGGVQSVMPSISMRPSPDASEDDSKVLLPDAPPVPTGAGQVDAVLERRASMQSRGSQGTHRSSSRVSRRGSGGPGEDVAGGPVRERRTSISSHPTVISTGSAANRSYHHDNGAYPGPSTAPPQEAVMAAGLSESRRMSSGSGGLSRSRRSSRGGPQQDPQSQTLMQSTSLSQHRRPSQEQPAAYEAPAPVFGRTAPLTGFRQSQTAPFEGYAPEWPMSGEGAGFAAASDQGAARPRPGPHDAGLEITGLVKGLHQEMDSLRQSLSELSEATGEEVDAVRRRSDAQYDEVKGQLGECLAYLKEVKASIDLLRPPAPAVVPPPAPAPAPPVYMSMAPPPGYVHTPVGHPQPLAVSPQRSYYGPGSDLMEELAGHLAAVRAAP